MLVVIQNDDPAGSYCTWHTLAEGVLYIGRHEHEGGRTVLYFYVSCKSLDHCKLGDPTGRERGAALPTPDS